MSIDCRHWRHEHDPLRGPRPHIFMPAQLLAAEWTPSTVPTQPNDLWSVPPVRALRSSACLVALSRGDQKPPPPPDDASIGSPKPPRRAAVLLGRRSGARSAIDGITMPIFEETMRVGPRWRAMPILLLILVPAQLAHPAGQATLPSAGRSLQLFRSLATGRRSVCPRPTRPPASNTRESAAGSSASDLSCHPVGIPTSWLALSLSELRSRGGGARRGGARLAGEAARMLDRSGDNPAFATNRARSKAAQGDIGRRAFVERCSVRVRLTSSLDRLGTPDAVQLRERPRCPSEPPSRSSPRAVPQDRRSSGPCRPGASRGVKRVQSDDI